MPKGITGGIYEAEICGTIEPTNRNKLVYTKIAQRKVGEVPYLPYEQAIDEIKSAQAWTDVRTFVSSRGTDVYFPKEVLLEMATQLGLEPEEESKRLKYFSAVFNAHGIKHTLDFHHGVDGFFEYYDENGALVKRITVDASYNQRKIRENEFKADFLIAPEEEASLKGTLLEGQKIFLPDPGSLKDMNDDFLDAITPIAARFVALIREAEEQRKEVARGMRGKQHRESFFRVA